ncbi:MAG: CapA family protein [Verrucomicrobiales bacterium]|nr:CapA family protein [Verrucomicrobiales bacterium]
MSVPRIVIAGDLYPGVLSSPLLQAGDAGAVFGDLMPDLQRADLRIVNLEGPLVSRPDPLPKIGPHHAIDEKCIKGLKAAGFDVLNVGNNHSMDQGESGLRNTLKSIGDAGLAAVGGGENLNAAGEVLVRRVGDVRVGILSYTEHEFGIASATRPGTNPLDLVHFIRTVESRRDAWDYLVVLLHGGNEYYPYPRPQLREWCRLMLERGARAVVLQHSHCPGCIEEHAGGYIVHGQGNFVFDERSARPCEQEGFLVILDIPDPARHSLTYVPFSLPQRTPGPRRMTGDAEQSFRTALDARSKEIQEPGAVERRWEEFCAGNTDRYLSLIHGYPRRIREWDMKFHFLRRFYNKRRMLMLLHLLRCESHRELLVNLLSRETRS